MENNELKSKVKNWWNGYPFTYFVKEDPGSWAFFRNVDRKILKWMGWAQPGYPLLSGVVDYASLKGKKVLDIACGTGWSTEQFVRAGADVTAIDLTPKAVELTKKRLELYGLKANVLVADAEHLPFPDGNFDYVLAWGCLMHTPNTEGAVEEIYRVLKPGGRFGAMMYNKFSLHWIYYIVLGKGIFKFQLLKYKLQELTNRYTDGAEIGGNMLTKFYSTAQIKKMYGKFKDVRVSIHDSEDMFDYFPHRWLPLGKLMPHIVKRFVAEHLGLDLWITGIK